MRAMFRQRYSLFAIILVICGLPSTRVVAQPACVSHCHPLYAGISTGYGSTTWYGLVPAQNNKNVAMSMSTPVNVKEGGIVWGLFVGYEFIPAFALEANYMHFPNARLNFDKDSLFAFNNNGLTYLNTHTEMGSLMAKIMLMIPSTPVRAYSSFGAAIVHRADDINVHNRVSPTFGMGLNYDVTEHTMLELAANYTAGYGESELNPVNDYIPFLYSLVLKLAYRI
jgi:hypothetical protein